MCDDCLDQALFAYQKALTLNFKDEELKNLDLEQEDDLKTYSQALLKSRIKLEDSKAMMDILLNRFPALSNAFINEGVSAFQDKEFATALERFEKSITISRLAMKTDTQVYYYASLAAINAKDWEKVIGYNTVLSQLGYGETDVDKVAIIQSLGMGHLNNADTAQFISTMEEGMEKYPASSQALVINMYNFYLDSDKTKALDYISMAIDNSPDNAQYYLIRGTLYEETDNADKAKGEYLNAIEIDAENFDANYSLGAFYYNQAADILEWADDSISTKKREEANQIFLKALPFLEKAKEIDAENVVLLQTLKTIYYRTGDLEKHDAVKAELNLLTQ